MQKHAPFLLGSSAKTHCDDILLPTAPKCFCVASGSGVVGTLPNDRPLSSVLPQRKPESHSLELASSSSATPRIRQRLSGRRASPLDVVLMTLASPGLEVLSWNLFSVVLHLQRQCLTPKNLGLMETLAFPFLGTWSEEEVHWERQGR